MRRFAIFKTGTHTSSQGITAEWSEEDLQRIVRLYNEQDAEERHDAPIVIGHPKDNSPAYGWIDKLEYEDGKLYALPKDVKPEFEEWVKDGHYRKVSVSLYSDGRLRHVGFLGGMPPAVKGLPEVAFAVEESEAQTYEFADDRVPTVTGLLRRLREYLIVEKGADEAEKILPAQELDRLNAEPWDETRYLREELARVSERLTGLLDDVRRLQGDTPTQSNPLFSENPMKENAPVDGAKPTPEGGPPADFAEQLKASDARIAALEAELKARDARVVALEAANQDASFREFLSSDELKGRIVPANRELAMAMLRSAAAISGEFEFAEGDETRKGTALDAAKAQLKGWPVLVEFGEVATHERAAAGKPAEKSKTGFELPERADFDEGRRELTIKARKLAAEKSISFNEALDIVLQEAE